ncbi:MAG: esterase [Caulobacter sp.]|nr:esterase [Caulobacter sp.]
MSLSGICDPRFRAVRDVFEKSFTDGEELGARFSFIVEGETVIDLWGGHADLKRERAFDEATLVPVFSVTKALTATLIARLVEAGKLSYTQPVAEVWPEFAQAGKAAITLEQMMSHQAGLPGFLEPMDPALWFDWDAICAKLAALPPMWPPGTASGYHAVTVGYLAGEVFRRVDGRTVGAALKEDVREALGLDLWIGLPDEQHGRVAELQRPKALPQFGEVTDPKKAAFLTPWAAPGGRSGADWRRAEIPSANGHVRGLDLARFMALLAGGDSPLLKASTVAEASRERIQGQDLVLPYVISWGAGYMRNVPNFFHGPTPTTFGHSGWGGACAFADTARHVAGAYVMNRQDVHLIGDPRSRRLIDAAYACL